MGKNVSPQLMLSNNNVLMELFQIYFYAKFVKLKSETNIVLFSASSDISIKCYSI